MKSALLAAGLGLALCLVAGAFAATPLYVPGIALLLMALAAGAWVGIAERGVLVRRALSSTVVEEGTPAVIAVSVARGHLPLPGADVRAWPGGPALPLPGPGTATITGAVRFPKRGRHRLGPASIVIADPLGLCSRTIISDTDELLVLPRIEPVHRVEADGDGGMVGLQARTGLEAGGTEVDSLQPHRPGSPASRIHWPTVARTATLIERRLVADGERAPVVVVDPRNPASPEDLDQAVRAAASLCVHLARHGGCSLLLPGDRQSTRIDPTLSGFSQPHARLALLAPGAGSPPLGCLTGASVVLWVSPTGLPARYQALRAPVQYLVSPHPGPWPVQFTVAGCSGQRVDLAGARRRAA